MKISWGWFVARVMVWYVTLAILLSAFTVTFWELVAVYGIILCTLLIARLDQWEDQSK